MVITWKFIKNIIIRTNIFRYERKVAAALFSEPPNSTYAEALSHFTQAEKLANFEWKENKLMIAKCKIATGDYQEAVGWLERANSCKQGDGLVSFHHALYVGR